LYDIERNHTIKVLDETKWNKTQAAKILGMSVSNFDKKLKRYGFKDADFK